jgi:hypothetical protein
MGLPFLAAFGLSIGLLTVPYEAWHIAIWVITAMLGSGAIYAINRRGGEYLDRRALAALRAQNQGS